MAPQLPEAFALTTQDLHDDVPVRGDASSDGQGAAVVAGRLLVGVLGGCLLRSPPQIAHRLLATPGQG